MSLHIAKLDEKLTKMLLDFYSEKTKLPAALYLKDRADRPIYSDLYWPVFCREICNVIGAENGCGREHSRIMAKNDFGLHQCFAGLWYYHRTIEVDGRVVGKFITGQMRISSKEEESKRDLKQTLFRFQADAKNSEKLIELWDDVRSIIKEEDFDENFVDHLLAIERYIITEYQRVNDIRALTVHSAHEILLPIQSIVANAENLYTELEVESEHRYIAEDILQEMIKLGHIAENILRGTIIEKRDGLGYEFYPEDIYPIIIDTISLFRKEAERKGVVINNPLVREDIPFSIIEMSEPHIKQVFFNLIHNAVKYSYKSTKKSGRYITTVCKPHKNLYCVEISNYGIGIKSDEIDRGLIFKTGYRGVLARDRSRTGSGIGLGVVKKIVEAHNGCVKVESKQVGIGQTIDPYKTTVKVCIPFHQPRRRPHGNKNDIMGRR